MQVTTTSRHLLVQLQIGQSAAGKPKLHNRAYPHVDVNASDTAIDNVLQALSPLFTDPVYAMGRVDTVQIQSAVASSGSSTGSASGTGSTGSASTGSTASAGATA